MQDTARGWDTSRASDGDQSRECHFRPGGRGIPATPWATQKLAIDLRGPTRLTIGQLNLQWSVATVLEAACALPTPPPPTRVPTRIAAPDVGPPRPPPFSLPTRSSHRTGTAGAVSSFRSGESLAMQ